jgi:predicted DNA-binding transcriptional regulator
MNRLRVLGVVVLLASLAGMLIYFCLVFFVAPLLVIQITMFAAVSVLLAIAASIGYTLATMPSPRSREEIERELEEELTQAQAKEQDEAESG